MTVPKVPVNRIKEVFTEESMRRALKAAKPGQLEEFASALHCTVPAADSPPTQAAVELELYSMCIRQAQLMSLDAWQTAYLLNIVKSVNDQSMAQYQLVETAFDLFRGHLIAHTVERPPFSKAVFTRQQSEQLLQWMLEAYFDYYKMYLYVFRSVITKTVKGTHPGEGLIEEPKIPWALTEAEEEVPPEAESAEGSAPSQ